MKLYKNAIILMAVVGLLGAAYFVTNNKKNTENLQNTSQISIIELQNMKPDTISEIDIEYKKERLVFLKNENKWTLAEPSNINYDQALADALPLSILYFKANKVITEKADDLVQYGLDNPSIITVKTTDGKSAKMEIGNLTSSKDGYYFKIKDSDKVYIVDKTKVDSILYTRQSIKDKNVLSLKREQQSRVLAADISSLSMKKNGNLVFTAVKNEDNGSWRITSPVEGNMELSKITPILNAISKVMAIEFIDDNPANFDKYGLKSPSYSLKFENSTGKKNLLIGDEKENGSEFYAMVEGQNDVFSLNEAGFNFLDQPFTNDPLTFTGYLIDEDCFVNADYVDPSTETRGCQLMPNCAASGYGISILQNNGYYKFYYFDGDISKVVKGKRVDKATKGQEKAWSFIKDNVIDANIPVIVKGTLTDSTHPVIIVDSINVTKGIPTYKTKITGYLVDAQSFLNAKIVGKDENAKSGYGVAVEQKDGTFKFCYFDGDFAPNATGGQKRAAEMLLSATKKDNISVSVEGVYKGRFHNLNGPAPEYNQYPNPVIEVSSVVF